MAILWWKMIQLNLLQLVNHTRLMNRRLFNLFALNEYQRYEAILSLPLSGDMKPSKLMSSMLALLLPASLILWSSLCLSPSLPQHETTGACLCCEIFFPPKKKSVRFLTQLETIIRWNPYRQIRERSPCSDLTSGGNDVKEDDSWVFWRTERGGQLSRNSAETKLFHILGIICRFLKLVNKLQTLKFVFIKRS